jgi:hypothetical protein
VENILYISQSLIEKLRSLACYLEEHSLYLLNLINELTFDEEDAEYLKERYANRLSSIFSRTQKIKEELKSLSSNHYEKNKCDVVFKNIFKVLGDDLTHLSGICEEIVDPNYYVDAAGILRRIEK